MLYKKRQLYILVVVILSASANFTPISYDKHDNLTTHQPIRRTRNVSSLKLAQEVAKTMDFAKIFKSLHRYLSPDEVRIVSTLGLLSGALRVEESMRENLYLLTDDLLASFNKTTPKENIKKLTAIDETINRDKSVVKVLNEMLKFARNQTTLNELEKEMIGILKEVRIDCRI